MEFEDRHIILVKWDKLYNEAYNCLSPLAFDFWLYAALGGGNVWANYKRGLKLLTAHKEHRFVGLKPYLGYSIAEWGF